MVVESYGENRQTHFISRIITGRGKKKKPGRDLLKLFVGSTIGTHIKIFFNVDFF